MTTFRWPCTAGALAPAAGALLTFCWLVGLARFIVARPSVELTLPRQAGWSPGDPHLAVLASGPTLRASSMERDVHAFHHVAYLVDGRARPTMNEKWASQVGDAVPWVELDFREPHHLERVVLRHVSDVEKEEQPVRKFRITCLRSGGHGPSIRVRKNRKKRSTHALDCPDALGVRVDFVPNEPGSRVVLYEIEAFGR